MKSRNNLINPLLTDLYEYTMVYSYFCNGRHEVDAVFDLFFRKNPFGGEFTLYAGLTEALNFIENYSLQQEEIDYVCAAMPRSSRRFRKWLENLDCSRVRVYSMPEGSVVFPHEPLLRVEGPLGICQLLESALLNLTAYPSLVATNAARMRLACGEGKKLIEFGLRRAQGPDGAVSAARYAYLGGFDGTSNMLTGYLFDIPVSGTQAHSYISSFTGLSEVKLTALKNDEGSDEEFFDNVLRFRRELGYEHTHEGELASFIVYAQSFPNGFLALVDTYDTLNSGVPNFLCVALALQMAGHRPVGVRLDSGDLSHLSKVVRRMYRETGKKYGVPFGDLKIVASNEINEDTLLSLFQQGHEVDIFGVGTHLVTCQADPSLGCVYKLVQIGDHPKIKISQEATKVTIPGRKTAYRLYGEQGWPLADIMIGPEEEPPQEGERVLCCHPYEEKKRTYIMPSKVVKLHQCVWEGGRTEHTPSLAESREHTRRQLASLRPDHLRPLNPTPYKVSLSKSLYEFMHRLWMDEAPTGAR